MADACFAAQNRSSERVLQGRPDMLQQMSPGGEIFIVDDDPDIREVLSLIFSREGFRVVCFADGAALLADARLHTPTCVILDVHIPGKSGLDILKKLSAQDYPAPIFIMSGSGDIPMAVQAIKNGALDFIEKPVRFDIAARVRDAIAAQARRGAPHGASRALSFHFPGCEPLTRREQDVLAQLVAGLSNKQAARRLGISPRTIEVHRAHIMEKLGAKNAADLIRISLDHGRAH
jgi:FixJ family two-component response regulator